MSAVDSRLPTKGQFGVALEPEIIKVCGYATIHWSGRRTGGASAAGDDLFLHQCILLRTILLCRYRPRPQSPWVVGDPGSGDRGLVVGIMVQYLEPTLKGHGTPEAMEAVLFGHSRMKLRVAILSPIATALAIGTGGPFGAEGPIIQTGAAFGSLFAQAMGLTPYYRRVLLASGAAAGMAATFTAPLAGILVAVELLLFEFRARSPIPVAFAAVVATGVRIYFAGSAPLFPMPAFSLLHMNELWLFGLMGVVMGAVAIGLIRSLAWLENLFERLPVKRPLIWAPVVGALILAPSDIFIRRSWVPATARFEIC